MKTETYKRWLKDADLKVTKHRLLVLDIMNHSHGFLTADDVYVNAKEQAADLSLSTVYRILDSFAENGIVSPINLDSAKQTHYEIAHTRHAHHLICTNCGRVEHIEHCPLDDFQKRIAKEHNFLIEDHKLELYGLCASCQT